MIQEKQIHYLLTVAEEKNITAAARKLFISQPALSRMILDLESSLGTPLFVRDRGNLRLTQAGEVYLRGCREVLAVSGAALKEIGDLKDNQCGRITLGMTSLTGEMLLPGILDDFETAFPRVELALVENGMSALQEMVKSGKVDMAFVYQNGDPELDYRLVLENPVYLQIPPGFLAERRPDVYQAAAFTAISLRPEELDGQPVILLKHGRGMREMADRFLERFQISPGKIMETDNIHLACSLVCRNRGFTFVPSLAVQRLTPDGGPCFYGRIEDYPMKRSLYCCSRKSGYMTKAERFLIELAGRPGLTSSCLRA